MFCSGAKLQMMLPDPNEGSDHAGFKAPDFGIQPVDQSRVRLLSQKQQQLYRELRRRRQVSIRLKIALNWVKFKEKLAASCKLQDYCPKQMEKGRT